MTTPLALVFYERLLPGSQLVNRLQDLGYRVQTISDVQTLVRQALQEKPLILVTVLAFTELKNEKMQASAAAAGTTIVAGNEAILDQLPQLLDQALQVE